MSLVLLFKSMDNNICTLPTENAKCIFDIGANTGLYALAAKAINPVSEVYAFEPIPRIFSRLKYNNDINEFNIHYVERAVTNTDGEIEIYDLPVMHPTSASLSRNFKQDEGSFPVSIIATKLDSFIRESGIKQVDLMKIDVETFEPEVIDGFSGFINQFMPAMIVEVLTDDVGARLQEKLKGLGYLYFDLDEDNNIAHITKEIRASSGFNYLICTESQANKLSLL